MIRRGTHKRAEGHGECGVALTEFIITAPFLFIMCAGVIDLGMVLGQYICLSEAVHTGLRHATTYTQLEAGTYKGLSPGQGTTCVPLGVSSSHSAVQQRVVDLISTYNRRADLTTLCVTSVVTPSTVDPAKSCIRVSATVEYQAVMPLIFSRIPITVEASGPKLD